MSQSDVTPIELAETPTEETEGSPVLKIAIAGAVIAATGVAAAYAIIKRRKSTVTLEEVSETEEPTENVA